MPHRVPLYAADDLDDLETLVDAARSPVVMVFDADNTLVPQGVPPAEFAESVTAAIERFAARPSVGRVIVLTNGPDRGVPSMISRGNKPWTSRRRLGVDADTERIWVVGDQVLTDGVLAWRLGATFVHLAIDEQNESPRQARMRRLGRRLARLLFLPQPTNG